MRTTLVTPYIFASIVVILAANVGATRILGAHPFWSVTVAWIGTPLGLIAAIALKASGARWLARVAIFAAALAAAYAVASIGKANFVASYAEDTLAGTMWHAGWIATTASAAALIAALFSPTPTPQSGG